MTIKIASPTLIILLVLCFTACNTKPSNENSNTLPEESEIQAPTPSLELVWETDSLLTTCEAVLYDQATGVIFVANVNNNPWELDNNGFISTIDTKGNITELKWVEGLSGPKGMGIANGKLYVNDIDRIVEIDIANKEILQTYPVDNSPALNDITVAPDGTVYASGSNSNTIYALKNGELNTVTTKDFGRLNGLLYQSEGIYFLSSASSQLGIYDPINDTTKVLTEAVGHGDGAVRLKNNDFIISSWKGEVFYINHNDWSKIQLLDTREQEINAADIDFIDQEDLLLVPTFFNNTVRCYRLVEK